MKVKQKIKWMLMSLFLLPIVSISNNDFSCVNANSVQAYYQPFYDDIYGKKGLELQNELSSLMASTQTNITSYGELKTEIGKTDIDPMIEDNIFTFYSRKSISKDWANSTVWNREHVWCKKHSSNLFLTISDSERNAGSDIHHLRPELVTVNSTRSDMPYGEIDKTNASVSEIQNTGNYYLSGVFEPRDDVKGDIARILMYVYIRYSSSLDAQEDYIKDLRGNLAITNIVSTLEGTASSAWEMLVKWNEEDPVSYLEVKRNDEIEKIQGNRNVFIDYPEFGKMCFASYDKEGAFIDRENSYDPTVPNYLGLDKTSMTIRSSSTATLNALVFPENEREKICYESTNSKVVRINQKGELIALSKGHATINVFTTSNLKATCEIEVISEEEIFKYDGVPLSSKTSYIENAEKEFEYDGNVMNIKASYSYTNNGELWLGPSKGKQAEQAAIILKDSPIGKGLNLNMDHRGSVLYFNNDLENINKVSYQQSKGVCDNLPSNLYLLYSVDNGNTYSLATKHVALGEKTDKFYFEFEEIERARYAFALLTYNPQTGYAQSRGPKVSFYSSEIDKSELINRIIDILKLNDEADFIFEAGLICYVLELYDTLDNNEKEEVNNYQKILNIDEQTLKAYKFIYNYLEKAINNYNEQTINELKEQYNNLDITTKEIINSKTNTYPRYSDYNTLGDLIANIDEIKESIGENEVDDKKEEIKLEEIVILIVSIVFVVVFTSIGVKKNNKKGKRKRK